MAGLRTEMPGEISKLRVEVFRNIEDLDERMSHVEGLLQGYIEPSRPEGGMTATE